MTDEVHLNASATLGDTTSGPQRVLVTSERDFGGRIVQAPAVLVRAPSGMQGQIHTATDAPAKPEPAQAVAPLDRESSEYAALFSPSARSGDAPATPSQSQRAPDSVGSPESTIALLEAAQIPADTVRQALDWATRGPTQTQEELDAIDRDGRDGLRAEMAQLWGDRMGANLSAINAYLDTLPANVATVIRNARDADGKALANDPATLQRLLGLAKQPRPERSTSGSIDAEIKSIETFMRRDRRGYDRSEQTQARYRELLGAKHGV
jgi:hypothetical protein